MELTGCQCRRSPFTGHRLITCDECRDLRRLTMSQLARVLPRTALIAGAVYLTIEGHWVMAWNLLVMVWFV